MEIGEVSTGGACDDCNVTAAATAALAGGQADLEAEEGHERLHRTSAPYLAIKDASALPCDFFKPNNPHPGQN